MATHSRSFVRDRVAWAVCGSARQESQSPPGRPPAPSWYQIGATSASQRGLSCPLLTTRHEEAPTGTDQSGLGFARLRGLNPVPATFSRSVFKTAALNHSAIPPNRYISTSYVGSSTFLCFVLATVLATVFNPFSLRLHQVIPQLRLSLSRDDARMTEDLLEGGQTTTPLQPQTRKSVAGHVPPCSNLTHGNHGLLPAGREAGNGT